jgi:D-apionolactonase
VRVGGIEVVRRIYMVFQDLNWTARPWEIASETIHAADDSFEIDLVARGTFDAAPFTWTGRLTGTADGVIRYEVDGVAEAPFLRNRLGLCVLHPMVGTSAHAARLETVDGRIVETSFPDAISPDQPFVDMRALTHEVYPGLSTTVRMTGDTFESEDHRNWSDASFKHYCTPIALPFPVEVRTGDRVDQAVEVTWDGPWPPDAGAHHESSIDIADVVLPLPDIGIQLDHDGHRLTPTEIERLAVLRLDHVRVDLDAAAPDALVRLRAAADDAASIGTTLEPALHVADVSDLARFAPFIDDPRIGCWLVFDPATKVTGPGLLHSAVEHLGDAVGGGTNLYFTELNRGRPDAAPTLAFSVNPQVHAWDDLTVLQNAVTQGVIARNARTLYPGARLEVSPITLRPRFNPNATQPELDISSTSLPSRVDARQCREFAAVWTVLSLKALAEAASIDAVTYFEATGWEGLMERAEGSPQPDDFASVPGGLFPVYDVLAAVAGATGVRPCTSSDPDRVDALALDDGTVLLANLTGEEQVVTVDGQRITASPMSVTTLHLPEGH